jgi:hypothetical protein
LCFGSCCAYELLEVLKRGMDLDLAESSPVPEAEEEVSSLAEEDEEDLPDQVIKSAALGAESPDSDTDLDDLGDSSKQADVEDFAFILQEAQCIAVEKKKAEDEKKRKTPKTYLGNSKKTQYCREKARKALAS